MKLARAATLTTLALLIATAGPAEAAPPKGTRVIERAAAAQPRPAWVEADYLEVPAPGHPARLALRVSMSPTGAIRQDIQDLGPRGSLSTSVWAPVGAAPAGAQVLDEAPGWLQVLSGRPLAAVLRAKEIDGAVTSFAHDGAIILWVLGAGPQAPEAPQIHVERETGRLRRFTEVVLGPPASDGGPRATAVVTVRLLGRAAPDGDKAGWPERIEIEGGGRTVTFALGSLTVGEPIDPDRFRAEPDDGAPDAPASPPAPGAATPGATL